MARKDERLERVRARQLWLLVMLLVCASCGSESETDVPTTPRTGRDEIPERYAWLYDQRRFTAAQRLEPESAELWANLPITAVALERQGCYGTCPQYTVRFERGALARYDGRRFAPREGRWTGDVGLYGYGLLCFLVERLHFEELSDSYAVHWTDDETVVLTVEWTDGRKKSVSDYGQGGPPELFALQRLIDSFADEIEWQPSDG